jgi:cysteine-rich repeat protein
VGGAYAGGGRAGQGGHAEGGHAGSLAALFPHCGNGMLEAGEDCDDGNVAQPDGCTAICQLMVGWTCAQVGKPCLPPVCGNGLLDSNEACDDSNTEDGDGCAANCRAVESGWTCGNPGHPCVPSCGDGLLKGKEQCDDHNRDNGDGCSSSCRLETSAECARSVCGDGVVTCEEECDDGGNNSDTRYGACATNCKRRPFCGDGNTDLPDESCDDAYRGGPTYALLPSPGCSWRCQPADYCGDGRVDANYGEACDLGAFNGQPGAVRSAPDRIVCDTACQFVAP